MDPIITVRNLGKTYRLGEIEIRALHDVSLTVQAGEFIALTGPSGSGKSTFMHLLGCLDRPTVGEYWLKGRDVTALSDNELAHIRNHDIGFVFQGFNLLPRTSALDNVELPMVYADHVPGRERRKRATEALRAVGLGDRLFHQSNQMSGGQQQRVAIARALVNNPTILLADEPTGNLDSRTSLEIIEIVQRLNRERGLTIVLVTHEHDIAQYAGRLISFLDGSIQLDKPILTPHDARVDLAATVEDESAPAPV